jgi:hypothetical protein
MALQANIDVVHVPYKGSVEIVPSIISGATQFAFSIASTALPQIQGGKVHRKPCASSTAAFRQIEMRGRLSENGRTRPIGPTSHNDPDRAVGLLRSGRSADQCDR